MYGPQPVGRALGEVRGARDQPLPKFEPVEAQHTQKRSAQMLAQLGTRMEFGAGRGIEQGRRGIDGARLRQREEPRDVVGDNFTTAVEPALTFGKEPAGVVGRAADLEL